MLVATLVLAAGLAASPPSLAQPDFSTANVSAEVAKFASEHFATQLTSRGVRVITAGEIATLIGQERQRQLMGCGEASSSCMAELANALGTDGTLLGQLGRFSGTYQINIKIVRSDTAALIATWSRSVTSEDKLIPALTDAAEELAPQILRALRPELAPKPREHRWPLVPSIVAGASAAASGAFVLAALSDKTKLEDPTGPAISPEDLKSTRSHGELMQNIARGAAVVAVGSLAVAGVLYALGDEVAPEKDVSADVAFGPSGAQVMFTVVLP